MDYIIGFIFLTAAFFALYKIRMYSSKGISKHWFAAAFAFKVVLAIVMFLMYSQNMEVKQNADIFRYFEDSKVISESITNNPADYFKLISGIDNGNSHLAEYYSKMNNWDYSQGNKQFSNNRLIIRYLAIINIFTFGSYYADMVLTIFLSFTGLFWIFKFFNSKIKNRTWIIFVIIFFFPSISFWSSGILKESLLIFTLGLLINCGNYALRNRKPIARSIIVIISLIVIYNIKAFILLILLPPLIAYIWNFYKPNKRIIIPYFIMLFIAFSFASESNKIMKTGVFDLLVDKQLSFTEIAIQQNAKSLISPILFNPNTKSVVINSPIALVNSLFRPMPWEANNLQMYASSIENIFILIIILLIVIFPNKKIENKNIFWFGLIFSISYLVIIGLSTPVLGAISRYRIPALIFMLLSMVQLIDVEKIKQIIYSKYNDK